MTKNLSWVISIDVLLDLLFFLMQHLIDRGCVLCGHGTVGDDRKMTIKN